jgi:AraC-like DNA-binding protein
MMRSFSTPQSTAVRPLAQEPPLQYLHPAGDQPVGAHLSVAARGRARVLRIDGLGVADPTSHVSAQLNASAGEFGLLCVLGLRGTAGYRIRGRVFEVRPGSILWFLPGHLESSREAAESSSDHAAWVGLFGRPLLSRVSNNSPRESPLRGAQAGGVLKPLSKVGARRLETQFEHLATLPVDSEALVVGLEYLLLSASTEHQKVTESAELTDVHPAVGKAAHILRTQPETGSMQQLARVCGASASWLSRLFRQQVGVSLVGYRNQSRIERFFELYGEGHSRNLTQAAHEAGFGSYAQFHRVFKEALGYSPAELKRGSSE